MNKYSILEYFLIFISLFVICNGDEICEIVDSYQCSDFTPIGKNNDTKCILTYDLESCQIKKCNQLDYGKCYLYGDFNQQMCRENENGDGCKLFSCSEMDPEKCDEFDLDDSEYKCLKIGSSCQLKKCSELKPPNCGKYIPDFSGQSCVASENECTIKECSDYKGDHCGDFTPRDLIYKCVSDPDNKGSCTLIEKECKDLPYEECNRLSPINGENGEVFECFQKADKTGCELKSCKAQSKENCGGFIPHNGYEKCVLNSEKNECEIDSCSKHSGNCGDFIPNDKSKKCTESENRCILEYKECEEFKNGECSNFNPYSYSNCENGDEGTCKLVSCNSLDKDQCQTFKPIDYSQCINLGESCELVYCEDLNSTQCDKYLTNDLNIRCVAKGKRCAFQEKDCSEIPVKYCKDEEYIRWSDNKICVLNDKKDKCILKGTEDESHILYMIILLAICIFAFLFLIKILF